MATRRTSKGAEYLYHYAIFAKLFKGFRKKAGISQTELAYRIGRTQSYVGKVERGSLRIDIIQLRKLVRAIGMSLPEFSSRLEHEIMKPPPPKPTMSIRSPRVSHVR